MKISLKLLREYRDVLQRNCLDCVNSVMMKDCLVYVCIAWNYDAYLLIWYGVTKYYLVLLKCLLLMNFFVFSTCSQTRGHQYKLFKKHNASR